MLKKRLLVLIVAILMLFASCATEIAVRYMQPSEINMGAYRNLALASVVPYKGFVSSSGWIRTIDIGSAGIRIRPSYSYDITNSIAAYATDRLYSTLSSSGYYNILPPSSTDQIIRSSWNESREFRELGYDAVMIPRIDAMNVDEQVYSVSRTATEYDAYTHSYYTYYYYDYYVKQVATITYTISVIDTNTDRIIASRTFQDSRTNTEMIDPDFPRFDKAELLFQRMIRSFDSGIIRLFVPTVRDYNVALMDNKPEIKELKDAYDAAKDGNTQFALDAFMAEWNRSHHVPSGFNAAVLTAALGDIDGAIAITEDVSRYSGESRVGTLLVDLRRVKSYNEEAEKQFTTPPASVLAPEGLGPDYSVYDYLTR